MVINKYDKPDVKPNFEDNFNESDTLNKQKNYFKFVNVNDSVIGILKAIEKGTFGDNYLIQTESGEVSVGSYSALKSKIESSHIGFKIKIVFLGEKKSLAGGRLYKDFKVYLKQ